MFLFLPIRIVFVTTILTIVINGLKNVRFEIRPKIVQKGGSAVLQCVYDLEHEPLYTVKFYRGSYEFYRYSPRDIPATKIFPFSGIQIDLSQSNSSQVTLTNVGFYLAGNFSCEVTTEAPSFSTCFVSEQMAVVDRQPIIRAEKTRYRLGDTLKANCSSAPSKPATNLLFYLNNVPLRNFEIHEKQLEQSLSKSDLVITVKLVPEHSWNGFIVLKCLAIIDTFYQQSTELKITFDSRDPIVEKIMYFNHDSNNENANSSSNSSSRHRYNKNNYIQIKAVHCCLFLALQLAICMRQTFGRIV